MTITHVRRFACALAAAACLIAAAPLAAAADTYPSHPITLIVPFSPGSTGDITARLITKKMEGTLGQPFIIENRPSAGGIVAATMIAKSRPDGYQLLLFSNTQSISAGLFAKLPYDTVNDFQMVGTFGAFSFGVVVAADSPLKTFQDFVAEAKKHPGDLNLGTTGVGATQNLTGLLLKSRTGVNVVVVPYNASGELLTALRGHHIQLMIENMSIVTPQIRSGTLRALAVTTADRYPLLPEIPTVAESGLPGFDVRSWNGIAGPKGMPAEVVQRLNTAIREAVGSTEIKTQFDRLGTVPYPGSPEDMRKLVANDIVKWTAVIKDAKIPLQ